MDESMASEPFLIKDELDTVAVEDGFLEFFQTFIDTIKKN